MAKAYLGSTQLKKAYIGSTAIKKIYRGSTLIWSGYQDETLAQKVRIEADGGTVIDLERIDLVISTLKTMGIYQYCKLLNSANFGVKKDITGAVSKLYDISGNNNDAVQTTGASQPIWSLVNGKGVITYDGVDDTIYIPNTRNLDAGTGDFTWSCNVNAKYASDFQQLYAANAGGSGYGFGVLFQDYNLRHEIRGAGGVRQIKYIDFTNYYSKLTKITIVISVSDYKTRLYLNNILVATIQFTAWGSINSTTNLYLSTYNSTAWRLSNSMTNMHIFTKALSLDQIALL